MYAAAHQLGLLYERYGIDCLKEYILSIIAVCVICAIAKSLLVNNGSIGRITSLLCGVLVTVTVITPFKHIKFVGITDYLNGLSGDASAYVQAGKILAENQAADIIKMQIEAYILDKADRMGLQIAVEVELDEKNGNIPCGASITGKISPYAREQLSSYMEEHLGIAKEKQKWI